MKKLLTTLSSIALLTASGAGLASSSTDAPAKQANIKEFQYEQAFVSPSRQPLPTKDVITAAAVEPVTDWQQKNAELQATKLPKAYLGIDSENAEAAAAPEKLAMAETTEASEAGGAAESVEAAEQPAEAATAGVVAADKVDSLSAEDHTRVEAVMIDLRWLITEGYVTEYGDGRLFAPPPMPEPKNKEVAVPATADVAAEAAQAATPEVAEPVAEEATSEAAVPAVEAEAAEPKVKDSAAEDKEA